jgi:predicted dehydrogenase
MSLRVGILGCAHVHAPSYAHCLAKIEGAEFVGTFDSDQARAESFSASHDGRVFATSAELIASVDAVCIASENVHHVSLAEEAFAAGKHVLCEKPLATTKADAERMIAGAARAGVILMTAFPCPFSPAFERALARVRAGEIGEILSICATNRGTCPHGWFTDKCLSGGGAMIDHTVHVADLFHRILGVAPVSVSAMVGNNLYRKEWEDTAMLTLTYPNGVFATLDSSWSRPASYRTWGDVTMNIVGTEGVIELDLFGPGIDVYTSGTKTHATHSYVSNLDQMMVEEFVNAIREKRAPSVTGEDGLAALEVALAGYESLAIGAK